ncbi:MAG: hypothetical protein ACI837_003290 [Crocinitomicaceae bacterium]|jgi:hypothetical protein
MTIFSRIPFMLIALVAIVSLLLTACSTPKDLENGTEIWTFELKKGGCMDVCVSYTISIESDGNYTYKGYFNVKHVGDKSGKIPKNELKVIQDKLASIDWESLDAEYGNPASNPPRKEINYASGTEKKTIVYSRLEPQEIRELEKIIDQLIDSDDL